MKPRMWRKRLAPFLLALALAGCSDGGDDSAVVVGAGGGGGGGGGGPVNPPSQNRTFSYPNVGANSRVTLIGNFQPGSETSSATAQVTAAVQQGPFSTLARMALPQADPGSTSGPATPGALPVTRTACGTADVTALTNLMGEGRVMGMSPKAEVRTQAATPVRSRFQELAEGAKQDFFLITAFKTVTAQKILQPNETVHCTIFAELDPAGNPCLSRDKALQIAQAFDSNNPARPGSGIYDQVRNEFGSEWNQNPVGGNDGDTKVVLMFFRSATLGQGLFGYTSPADQSQTPTDLGNKGEIVYINADKDLVQNLATLAHEFQHLINQNEKIVRQGTFPAGAMDENVTVNEGLSGLSEEICGYGFDVSDLLVDICNDYLSRPEEHEFFDFFAAGLGYGEGFLFFKYAREQYGDQVIRSIVTSPQVGLANLDAQLPNGFAENFRRWTVANYATNLSGQVPKEYRYPSGFRTDGNYGAGQLVGVRTFPMGTGQNRTDPLGAWSTQYLTFSDGNGDDLRLDVATAPNSPVGVVFEAVEGTLTSFDQ